MVGATGVQGGSVIRELARSDKPYRIRGLTRDPTKPAAQALAKEGVEVRAVNIVLGSEKAVQEAFKGGDVVFIVTNFWEHLDKSREAAEGKLMIDAALAVGVEKIIWSGLQSFAEASGGKYKNVDHFEGKWEITLYGRERVKGTDVAFVNVDAGSYASNLHGEVGPIMAPQAKGDGTFVFKFPTAPDAKIPIIDMAHDYGLFVRHAIESPEYAHGGEILTASELISMRDAARQLSEVTGKTVTYEQEAPEAFVGRMKATGWGTDRVHLEMTENMLAYTDVGYYCGRSVIDFNKLPRKPHTWKEYVASQDWSNLLA